MGFYHSWVYLNVLDTVWFMRTIVCIVLFVNLLWPAIVWLYVRSGRNRTQ